MLEILLCNIFHKLAYKPNSGINPQISTGPTLTIWRNSIISKLGDYCEIDIDASEHHIIVSCKNPDSFDVSFHAFDERFQVGFDGWHEHVESEDDALKCFAFGLSEECPLKV